MDYRPNKDVSRHRVLDSPATGGATGDTFVGIILSIGARAGAVTGVASGNQHKRQNQNARRKLQRAMAKDGKLIPCSKNFKITLCTETYE